MIVLPQKILEVSNLTVEVGGKIVVKNANIEIERGEISVLLGPNGSGKTTMLKAIMGLSDYKIVEGKILLDSVDITSLPPWERARMGLALSYQNPPPLPIKMGMLLERISKIYGKEVNITNAVNQTVITHLLERNAFSGFSGGEIKRSELTTILLSKPKVALLDEPDSGVDVESVRKIAKLIDQLAEEGTGILLVTHVGLLARYLRRLGKGYVMMRGIVSPGGDARKILKIVLNEGYENLYRR